MIKKVKGSGTRCYNNTCNLIPVRVQEAGHRDSREPRQIGTIVSVPGFPSAPLTSTGRSTDTACTCVLIILGGI